MPIISPEIPSQNIAPENQNSNVVVMDSNPIKKNWILISVILAIVIMFVSVLFYKLNFNNLLIVSDQPVSATLSIEKLSLQRGGFLMIDWANLPSNYTFTSEYIPAGTYTNFDVAYSHQGIDPEKTTELRAFVYEDVNGDQFFNDDIVKVDLFGFPLLKHFKIGGKISTPLVCSNGFDDDFNTKAIDKNKWGSYIWSSQGSGRLTQKAMGNLPVGNSTTLYSKNMFSGDLMISALIESLDVQKITQDSVGTVEFEIFTVNDRVASVKWNKQGQESFLSLGLDSNAEASPSAESTKRYNIASDSSVELRIIRIGTKITAAVRQSGGEYVEVWNIPNVSTEAVYVGIETADRSAIPTEVVSLTDKISITCP